MRVVLDVLEGPRKGGVFVCDGGESLVVGRSKYVTCSMPEDTALSRDHFKIDTDREGCELRDLGSTNGTFVNDERVERAVLATGDKISAGQSTFLVRVEAEDGAPAGSQAPTAAATSAPMSIALTPRGVPISCAGCGQIAPPGIDVAAFAQNDVRESITWLCESCRREAAVTHQPVPQYTTLRILGRGAMGVVYLAQQHSSGRLVALKLIAPETAAARSAIDRFLREMHVVSQLKHPNIVEYLEQGTNRGQFWFAMEYVEGTNLEALANEQRGTYPINQACRMASQVLKGLEHAHASGFVHRDIKPENILIGRTPKGLLAKISDFGLAKSFRSLGLSGLTFSGEMRGTIPFMPPEQMLDFKKVQPSGDLYATAATLYYLISGQFIYDEVAEGGDLIRILLEEPPVPIQKRRPDVPTGLARVLEKGLARDPKDRYPTAESLRAALRRFC